MVTHWSHYTLSPNKQISPSTIVIHLQTRPVVNKTEWTGDCKLKNIMSKVGNNRWSLQHVNTKAVSAQFGQK